MIETIGTIGTIAAIIGVILNNRLRIECFYIRIISNALFAGIHLSAGIYSLLIRDLIFILLAIEGIHKWTKKANG